MKSPDISEFSLIILVRISVFYVALLMFRLFSSLRISSFWTVLNEKWGLELQNFLIATILGWFWYLTIAFRSGSFIFSDRITHIILLNVQVLDNIWKESV